MADLKLKPCPFCGGEAKIAKFDWGYSIKEYWTYCKCGCELKAKARTIPQAIKEWNRRVSND